MPRPARIARWTTAAVVLLIAFVVAGLLLRALPHEIPAPDGRFAVGRVIFPRQPHTLVALWYPTVAGAPGLPADYFPAQSLRTVRQEEGLRRLLSQNLAEVRVNAIEDAPISLEKAVYPVVLLLPGKGRLPFSYTALAERMASNGWVVAGLDAGTSPAGSAGIFEAALTVLGNLNESGTGQFSGRLDLSHLAVVGDPADAPDFAAVQNSLLPPVVPVVLFGGGRGSGESTAPLEEPVLRLSASGAEPSNASVDIPIPGARPADYTDEGFLFAPAARLTGRLGSIPAEQFHRIVAELVETFVEGAWSAMDVGTGSYTPVDRTVLLRNAVSAATVAVREKALSYPLLRR